MRQANANLRLIGRHGEVLISIDSRSWHVLDEPDLFPEGAQLLSAFGITWAEPPFGILKRRPASQFRQSCKMAWQPRLRDQELLSYSYQYELQRERGVPRGNLASGIFHVRGLAGSVKTTPKGYCTLRLRATSPDSSSRYPVVQVIDLRKERQIETDDAGCLKVRRRAMTVAWYREMPRILESCEENGTDEIEVRLRDGMKRPTE